MLNRCRICDIDSSRLHVACDIESVVRKKARRGSIEAVEWDGGFINYRRVRYGLSLRPSLNDAHMTTNLTATGYELNLMLAWLWIVLGIGSGCVLGLGFHRENWLGGYGSFRRRLYRLGHISFFGLGLLNLAFAYTAREMGIGAMPGAMGAWGFAVGALTMPVCCVAMAHWPRSHALFAIPVLSLAVGAVATLVGLAGWIGG
jgi:hypothetical protein